MTRDLTTSEAKVVAALLGAADEPERSRLARTGLPRSTYVVARRKAYDEGWVRDRFLPHPDLGVHALSFVLARPFVESRSALEAQWAADPAAVLVWRLPEHLFGVFLHRGTAALERWKKGLTQAQGPAPEVLSADPTDEEVPVYFDFEGAWTHFAGLPGSGRYPRSLGPGRPGGRPAPSPGLRRTALELVGRDGMATEPSEGRRFLGALGLPRSQRRLLEQGWAEWRVLPDLAALPAYDGQRISRCVLLRGTLLEDRTLPGLFAALVEECRVYPFLLVAEGERVLVGALGRGEGRHPAPEGPPSPGVLATLRGHLKNIESTSADLDRTTSVKDHEYAPALAGG